VSNENTISFTSDELEELVEGVSSVLDFLLGETEALSFLIVTVVDSSFAW